MDTAAGKGSGECGRLARWTWFLCRFDGTIDRLPFVALGAALFLVKYSVDASVAALVFERTWSVSNYLAQEQVQMFAAMISDPPQHVLFHLTMLGISAPFVVCGVSLLTRRLRSIGAPLGFVVLFFVPVINLFFLLFVALAPAERWNEPCESIPEATVREGAVGRAIPRHWLGNAAATIGVVTVLGLADAAFSIYALGLYGAGLFVGLPFCLGMLAAVLYSYHDERSAGACAGVAVLSTLALEAILFLLAIEGIGCLAMAFPLIVPLSAFGGLVGHAIRSTAASDRDAVVLMLLLVLVVPTFMGVEAVTSPPSSEFAVTSSVTIDAPPETVWNNVVSFPDLPPPDEWVFRLGAAYPVGATIDGVGPGAVRRCRFSTGDFVEPIEEWNAPRLLSFRVTENPPAMREWSPYEHVHPPHLEGFLVSKKGQFALEPNGQGGTTLRGTTWYSHSMRPELYWRLWSDSIIHAIHLRVLEHVEKLSESTEAPAAPVASGTITEKHSD